MVGAMQVGVLQEQVEAGLQGQRELQERLEAEKQEVGASLACSSNALQVVQVCSERLMDGRDILSAVMFLLAETLLIAFMFLLAQVTRLAAELDVVEAAKWQLEGQLSEQVGSAAACYRFGGSQSS